MVKRLLLTGSAGFMGHHLLNYLMRETDFEIMGMDRLDTSGTLFRVAEVLSHYSKTEQKRFKQIWHDLKAPVNEHVIKQIGKVDYILHLAAGTHVDRSISFPLEFVYDNVVGTANLLEYIRIVEPELFIYFSTDEVFGSAPADIKYKEDTVYRSGNPYAATKAGAEQLVMSYQNTFKINSIITNTMNIFGIRQHPEKFIPSTIKKVRDEGKVIIHANPDKTKAGSRFYINAKDVASAMLFLIKNGKVGERYNVVGKKETDNLTLAKTIAKHVGKELNYELVDFHSSRPGHDLRYALDGGKLGAMGWWPQEDIDEQLKEVVDWTLANPRWLGED